jgi:putative oxidoreductase
MFRWLIQTSPVWVTLPIRIALGLIFIAHGAQKVFGVWGGPGLSAFMENRGNPAPFGLSPVWLWMGAAAFAELIGGVLVLIGLLTRLGALLIAPVMLVAMFGVHWGAFFLQNSGIEYTVALLAMALGLIISGGGRASVDETLMTTRGRRR